MQVMLYGKKHHKLLVLLKPIICKEHSLTSNSLMPLITSFVMKTRLCISIGWHYFLNYSLAHKKSLRWITTFTYNPLTFYEWAQCLGEGSRAEWINAKPCTLCRIMLMHGEPKQCHCFVQFVAQAVIVFWCCANLMEKQIPAPRHLR